MTTVTIHQPNYAPWTGFFDKLAQADVFVLLDTVAYTKGGYQNRVKVLGSAGGQWLTVPVLTKGLLGQPTHQVRVDDLKRWRTTHLKTLHALYRKAPHAELLFDLAERALTVKTDSLATICTGLIREVAAGYGFDTTLVLASDLPVSGSSSALLADIVTACGGERYLSGPSGRTYLDESVFDEAGISIDYHSFTPVPYPQVVPGFVGGLSIYDAVAHLGWGLGWRNDGNR